MAPAEGGAANAVRARRVRMCRRPARARDLLLAKMLRREVSPGERPRACYWGGHDCYLHARDGGVFPCHKAVLARCPKLRRILKSSSRACCCAEADLFLPDVTPAALGAALRFVYTGELVLVQSAQDEVQSVLADVFGVEGVAVNDVMAADDTLECIYCQAELRADQMDQHYRQKVEDAIKECERKIKSGEVQAGATIFCDFCRQNKIDLSKETPRAHFEVHKHQLKVHVETQLGYSLPEEEDVPASPSDPPAAAAAAAVVSVPSTSGEATATVAIPSTSSGATAAAVSVPSAFAVPSRKPKKRRHADKNGISVGEGEGGAGKGNGDSGGSNNGPVNVISGTDSLKLTIKKALLPMPKKKKKHKKQKPDPPPPTSSSSTPNNLAPPQQPGDDQQPAASNVLTEVDVNQPHHEQQQREDQEAERGEPQKNGNKASYDVADIEAEMMLEDVDD